MDEHERRKRALRKRRAKANKFLALARSASELSKVVRQKLKRGFEPDHSQLIHYAAIQGDLEVVRKLVELCDCDPVCQNQYGITPLHCASYCGRLNVVEYIQKRCTNAATQEDIDGACPLVYSTYCVMKDVTVNSPLDAYRCVTPCGDHIKIAIFLLPYSIPLASSSLSDLVGVLRLPACYGRPTDMKCMVQVFPAEIKSDDKFSCEVYECLKIAVDRNRWEFVKYLLQAFPQPIKSAMVSDGTGTKQSYRTWELNPFQNACKKANISIVKIFLDHNICKPDTVSIKAALERKHYELLHYLLTSAECPIVMDKCEYSQSLLSNVLTSHKYEKYERKFIELIASNGANSRDIEGNTVLHLACEYSVIFLVKEYNCNDQGTANNKGQLPLHIACSRCNLEAIKLVSSHPGINLNAKDSEGDTPVHVMCKQYNMLHWFDTRHSEVESHKNKSKLLLECLRYLVQGKKCDIAIRDGQGQLPLHVLLERSKLNSLSIDEEVKKDLITLMSTNDTVNVQDKAGNTPLHIACETKDWVTALYLTSKFQCDVNVCNNSGCLPLHCAIHRLTVTRDTIRRYEEFPLKVSHNLKPVKAFWLGLMNQICL